MSQTRLLVADACPIFRTGVRAVLAREADFACVEAGSFDEVLGALARECPTIALVDVNLPPLGGLDAIRELADAGALPVAWGFDPAPESVLGAIRAGASGFLTKDVSGEGLVRALRGLCKGEAALSRDLALLMIGALHGLDRTGRARERASTLSDRELEVLQMVARGARNRQVAEALAFSEFTVKRHMQNILHKLNLASRSAAAAFYRMAFESEPAVPRTQPAGSHA